MINFRYHIVSITAVFLALGIGVALGSTFLDQATVDVLNRNIRSAENRIKDTNAENEQLRATDQRAQARDQALVQDAAAFLGDDLTDVPVVVVVAPGVDGDVVDRILGVLDATGADLRGTLSLTDRLGVPDDGAVDADVAASLDVAAEPAALRAGIRRALVEALVAAGQPTTGPSGADATTTTTVPATTTTVAGTAGSEPSDPSTTALADASALVSLLADKGYLSVEAGPGLDAASPLLDREGHRYLYVTQPGLDASADSILLGLLPTGSDLQVPAVVVTSTAPARGEDDPELPPDAVAQIRASEDLSARYGTVDDADTFTGLAAAVLSLDVLGDQAPGHYGQGEGATSVLPPAS